MNDKAQNEKVKRIRQLEVAIICLQNADHQGPEGRAKLDTLQKELDQLRTA